MTSQLSRVFDVDVATRRLARWTGPRRRPAGPDADGPGGLRAALARTRRPPGCAAAP